MSRALLAISLAGCGSGPGDPSPPPAPPPPPPPPPQPVQVTWQFCHRDPARLPDWVAAQDGSGAWARITGTNDQYTFPITTRGAIAWVDLHPAGARIRLVYGSLAELQATATSQCFPTGAKPVHGTFAGAAFDDGVAFQLGDQLVESFGVFPQFSFSAVASGPRDFLGRIAGAFASIPIRSPLKLVIRRGLDPTPGSTLPVVDFGGAEARAVVTAQIGLTPPAVAGGLIQTALVTATDSLYLGSTDVVGGATLGSGFYPPASALIPTDLLGTALTLATGTEILVAGAYGTNPPASLTMGPSLTTATAVTVATTPYFRIRYRIGQRADYPNMVGFFHLDPAGRIVYTRVTAGYRGTEDPFELTFPDFSSVAGWDNAWGPTPNGESALRFEAFGWSAAGGVLAPPRAAGTWRSGQLGARLRP